MIAISSTTEKKSSVKMNEDLARWLNEAPEKISGEFDTNLATNKPKGKCKICGAHMATAVCVKCGKPVCNDHYYHIIGVCEKCLSKETVEKWKKHNPNWKKLLGVDWLD
jgi:hypothetical protein